MNTKRRKKQLSLSELVLMGLAAVLFASGGVMHAYAKNKEVEIARKVDAVKKEIEENEEAVQMVKVKIDRKLDRYLLKEALLVQRSQLRETKPTQFELVNPEGEEMADAQ